MYSSRSALKKQRGGVIVDYSGDKAVVAEIQRLAELEASKVDPKDKQTVYDNTMEKLQNSPEMIDFRKKIVDKIAAKDASTVSVRKQEQARELSQLSQKKAVIPQPNDFDELEKTLKNILDMATQSDSLIVQINDMISKLKKSFVEYEKAQGKLKDQVETATKSKDSDKAIVEDLKQQLADATRRVQETRDKITQLSQIALNIHDKVKSQQVNLQTILADTPTQSGAGKTKMVSLDTMSEHQLHVIAHTIFNIPNYHIMSKSKLIKLLKELKTKMKVPDIKLLTSAYSTRKLM
jgi:chromosome segregation ATPase